MSTSQDDSRLVVPGYTILILFVTLALLIPLVSYRMAQSLVTPPVTELMEPGSDQNNRSWRSGIWKYGVNLTLPVPEGEEGGPQPGVLNVTFSKLESVNTEELDLPTSSYTMAVDFDADRLRDIIFLDSNGDGCHTLIVWGGEFGRTPTSENGNGRDHNHHGFTMWMAGAGVQGGMRYGETDDFGFKAVVNKVHVHDLHATILHLLGIDHERLTYRHAGRDYRLTDVYGRVVKEILA